VAAAALVVLSVAPVRAVARTEAGAVVAQSDRLLPKIREAEQPRTRASAPRRIRAMDRALYEAAQEGDFEGVKEMVAAGANPSAKIEGDGSPLIGAARSGRSEITKFLLDQGADPNGVVEGDGSPLIAAAAFGRDDQVQMLIDRGADVNLAVEGDENPLMNAAEQGHLRIVQLLVEKGADIHAKIYSEKYQGGGEWRTAISQARKNGHMDVVRYLESRGARE
jgi:ankyrin repeat protein